MTNSESSDNLYEDRLSQQSSERWQLLSSLLQIAVDAEKKVAESTEYWVKG